MRSCTNCGRLTEDWSRYSYCTGCGKQIGPIAVDEIKPPLRICGGCANLVLPGQDYCGMCGMQAERQPPMFNFVTPFKKESGPQ